MPYMYVFMYVCIYACMNGCVYGCISVCMYVCMYFFHVCTYGYVCMQEWMFLAGFPGAERAKTAYKRTPTPISDHYPSFQTISRRLKMFDFFQFFLPSAPLQNQWGFPELQGPPLGRQLDPAKTHGKIKNDFFTNFSDFS